VSACVNGGVGHSDFCCEVVGQLRGLEQMLLDQMKEEEEEGGCEMCERFMPLTRHHLIPKRLHADYRKRDPHTYTQEYLNQTAGICRPCHSAIHRIVDLKSMGREYNTIDKLMTLEKVQAFVKWAAKQRLTSKADAKNAKLNYRR